MATSADREAIAGLLSRTSTSPGLARRALSAIDGRDACATIALAEGEGAVGIGVLEVQIQAEAAPVGRVFLLAVLEDWRGRGVGAALLEALRREAAARGLGEMRVATR